MYPATTFNQKRFGTSGILQLLHECIDSSRCYTIPFIPIERATCLDYWNSKIAHQRRGKLNIIFNKSIGCIIAWRSADRSGQRTTLSYFTYCTGYAQKYFILTPSLKTPFFPIYNDQICWWCVLALSALGGQQGFIYTWDENKLFRNDQSYPCFDIKTVSPGIGIPIIKIRRPWNPLIFII